MRDIRFRDSLPDLVGKLFRHVARVHNRALKPFELSAVHAHVLAALWLSGPMTMGELQAGLALGSSTATGAIDRMERLGLVRRSDVAGDRRAVRLEPASWTARRREAVLDALAKTEDDAFSGLTRAERRELARLLAKAIESIAQVDRGDDE
jgi:DNA-binding MarR family transcriptional regulator